MLKKYLKLSTEIANLFSHDDHIKVGSVILEKDSLDTISIGYNRFPINNCDKDIESQIEIMNQSPKKYTSIIHAEETAIKNAKKYNLSLKGNIIVVTQFPCKNCAILIIKSGISKVVTFHREVRGRWWDDEPSKKLFDKYNIGVETHEK